MRGRDYALPEDVRDLALDVLRHRIVLSYEALADNVSADDVLTRVLAAIPLPEVPLHERRPRPDDASTAPSTTPERILRRLEWRVIRRLDGQLQGDYRTLFRGVGIDFADLREYEPGDDVRHIDWNVTARMDTPVRAHVPGGPRADGLAPARPLAVDGVRADRPLEGAGADRAGGRRWPGC